MKKILFAGELCILRKIHPKYMIVYSYKRGYYYLIYADLLDSIYDHEGIYELNEYYSDLVWNNILDPNTVSIEIFNSPIVVGIMFSNICNLSCTYCIAENAGSYSQDNWIEKRYVEFISKINESNVVGMTISGGEPTLNKNIVPFLEKLMHEKYLCEFDTNGILFTKELLNIFENGFLIPRISLDSIDEKIHNSVRGGWRFTIENIKILLEHNIEFRINTVLHAMNANDIVNLGEWMKKNKIEKWHIYKLQKIYAPRYLWLSDEETEDKINGIKKKFFGEIEVLAKYAKKIDGYSSFMIDSEGTCFSSKGSEKVCFGNIFAQSIEDVWNGTSIEYRKNHINKFLYFKEKTI